MSHCQGTQHHPNYGLCGYGYLRAAHDYKQGWGGNFYQVVVATKCAHLTNWQLSEDAEDLLHITDTPDTKGG